MEELPPRTRRILFPHLKRGHVFGTTSAYAENTECSIDRAGEAGNYLRVRGEYSSDKSSGLSGLELPPRTRRIPRFAHSMLSNAGTTSAYAENTPSSRQDLAIYWNYLRVRGEYADVRRGYAGGVELPPRTRRIPAQLLHAYRIRGTTSAYAENT